MSHLGIYSDKPLVEVCESGEHLHTSNELQCQLFPDCRNLVQFPADFIGSCDQPQEADFRNSKLIVLSFAIETEFLEVLRHLSCMLLMVLLVCRTE